MSFPDSRSVYRSMHGSRETLPDPDVRENDYSTSWLFPFAEAISKTLKRGPFILITSSFNHLLQQPLLNSSEINDLLTQVIFNFFFGWKIADIESIAAHHRILAL